MEPAVNLHAGMFVIMEGTAGHPIPADLHSVRSVSYTHLDVYKRQIVIFLTANDQESDQIRGYEVGAVDYITRCV